MILDRDSRCARARDRRGEADDTLFCLLPTCVENGEALKKVNNSWGNPPEADKAGTRARAPSPRLSARHIPAPLGSSPNVWPNPSAPPPTPASPKSEAGAPTHSSRSLSLEEDFPEDRESFPSPSHLGRSFDARSP